NREYTPRIRFERLKREFPIGIYGSFYLERKNDLIRLRDAVRQYGYHNACISEDLDDRPQEARDPPDPIYDRHLSVQLIDRSVAHVFVLAMPGDSEPANLIQSVSMELERLTALMDHRIKDHQDVMLLVHNGLWTASQGAPETCAKD
ncbi:hypothetical protein, partial [Methanoculleus sp. MH98A]|uniref:hypothetical protein n=1 Tax=Methanoculleus sp. MH98A TaxID=1495314 RepID=UPI00064F4460